MVDSSSPFDASVGLAFSLKAFEVYRKSGTLSAEVRSFPGIRGKCTACLEIVQGKVVAGYVVDKAGENHSTNQQMLVQLDTEKGPFSWVFHPDPTPDIASPVPGSTPRMSTQPRIPAQSAPGSMPGTSTQPRIPAQSAPGSTPPRVPAQPQTPSPVPQPQVRYLEHQQMQQWTTQQQHLIHTVFSMVNGQRSIADIKQQMPLPPITIDEIIRILLYLKAITLQQPE